MAAAFAGLALLALRDELHYGYLHYALSSQSDPMIVTFVLAAIDLALSGRRRAAFACGVLASLGRPEAWPFLALCSVWLWRRERADRWLVAGAWVLLLALWFGIPAISSRTPFVSAANALDSGRAPSGDRVTAVLSRFGELQHWPVYVAAALCVALAARCGAHRRGIAQRWRWRAGSSSGWRSRSPSGCTAGPRWGATCSSRPRSRPCWRAPSRDACSPPTGVGSHPVSIGARSRGFARPTPTGSSRSANRGDSLRPLRTNSPRSSPSGVGSCARFWPTPPANDPGAQALPAGGCAGERRSRRAALPAGSPGSAARPGDAPAPSGADREAAAALAGALVVAALVAAMVPAAVSAVRGERSDLIHQHARTAEIEALPGVVDRLGGAGRLHGCGEPLTRLQYQTALAFALGDNVSQVGFKYSEALAHGNPVLFITPFESGVGWRVQAAHQTAPACASLPTSAANF